MLDPVWLIIWMGIISLVCLLLFIMVCYIWKQCENVRYEMMKQRARMNAMPDKPVIVRRKLNLKETPPDDFTIDLTQLEDL